MRGSPSIQKSSPVAIAYDHEKYVRLSIQQTRWILKSIGAWPRSLESTSPLNRYAHLLMNVICIGLVIFLFVPCALFVALEVEDTYSTLKFTGPLSFCLMVFLKYISLIFHGRDIRVCVEHVKSDWMNTRHRGDRAIMVRNAEFARRLVMTCTIFTYGSAAFYHIAMPISAGKVTEEDSNMTYQPLVYPVARAIVDTRHSPISEIFFWIQCVAGFVTQAVTAAACCLTVVLAIHAYGRLEVLVQWIVHLVDGREDFCNNVDERLAIIVREHVRILRFISLTEKVLHEISLVEIVGCTLNLCFLGYYVIMEWEIGDFATYVTYVILLISFTFNIFLFCYIGELVAEQCKRISEISYMIDWHRLAGRKALAVILMIAMSNSSVKLTAGNIIDLSISSFGDVIKTSVAYLNMLRKLTS
ncbi:uncharacterized protein LOC112457875 [Temnothorax curvispinosus]|uniref:Odorant receptor n=1 Tax=Temnothorax curvispinosus TaxID=300111 RepID=A0A6J1Q442_9HYME|nr:uncharacterized protein LOC112457875 [Temnothorax curvispinosus]